MSCYFRHMKNILDEAGIQVTLSNKKEIDQAFHRFSPAPVYSALLELFLPLVNGVCPRF